MSAPEKTTLLRGGAIYTPADPFATAMVIQAVASAYNGMYRRAWKLARTANLEKGRLYSARAFCSCSRLAHIGCDSP